VVFGPYDPLNPNNAKIVFMNTEQKGNKTEAEFRHQRQFVWQILIPILAAVIVFLLIVVLSISVAGSTPELNEKWAHISTVFLLLPTFLFGLITLALVILLIWLIEKLSHKIPTYTGYIFQLSRQTRRLTDTLTTSGAEPFIRARSSLAGLARLVTIAFHNNTNHKE